LPSTNSDGPNSLHEFIQSVRDENGN